MNTPLRNQLSTQISALRGFNFQHFIHLVFGMRYGSDDFVPLRDSKDKGCDGLIRSLKTVVACYGSDKYDKAKFERKADGDFQEYRVNWEIEYPNWMMVVNQALSPDHLKKVESLKSGSRILGIGQTITMIEEELTNNQKRKIAQSLRIDETYIVNDFVQEIFDDLIKGAVDAPPFRFNSRIDIEEKIRINFTKKDFQEALDEYENVAVSFGEISEIMRPYEEIEKSIIKYRIQSDFNKNNGNFKYKFNRLTEAYIEKYKAINDDELKFYIRSLLFYTFEQCLIGKKTRNENDPSTS